LGVVYLLDIFLGVWGEINVDFSLIFMNFSGVRENFSARARHARNGVSRTSAANSTVRGATVTIS
jgi:hypothetical protein